MADDADSAAAAGVPRMEPLVVFYCGVCSMPPEYCSYGPCPQRCREWLKTNHADRFAAIYGDDADAAAALPTASASSTTASTAAAAAAAEATAPSADEQSAPASTSSAAAAAAGEASDATDKDKPRSAFPPSSHHHVEYPIISITRANPSPCHVHFQILSTKACSSSDHVHDQITMSCPSST
jgi:hypothetical protein